MRLKLVFVATAALVLAAAIALFGSVALAQPAPGASSNLAASDLSSRMFERRVATIPDDVRQDQRLSPGPIIGLICAIVASSVALGIAFGIRRRIDRIAGPDPEKADDD